MSRPNGARPRLAFMGAPDFAGAALKAMIDADRAPLVVYTQPPRRAHRGKRETPTPVQRLAEAHGIPLETPKSLRAGEAQARFAAHDLDAAVVAAYGLILPQPVLDGPRMGCLNIHASLLPRWRGAAPIQRAIMAGDRETGVCLMAMTAGLDEGPVIARATTPIGPETTAARLHDRLAVLGAELLVAHLDDWLAGEVVATPQADEGATYAAKIDKAEARIDWTRGAHEIDRQVRGLSPFPGAWFAHGEARLKALDARLGEGSGAPGEVLASGEDGLTVACGAGAVRLIRLQRAGKAAAAAGEILRGHPIAPGTRLS